MGVFKISYWVGHVPDVEAMWTSTWAEVAPKRAQLGAKLRHVGAKMGRSWSQVDPSWPKLTPIGADVATCAPPAEAVLTDLSVRIPRC